MVIIVIVGYSGDRRKAGDGVYVAKDASILILVVVVWVTCYNF